MVKLDFGGVKEDVITRKEFTVAQAQKILKDEVVVSLGYGIQGQAQSLNMRDNGIKVIIGQEKHRPLQKRVGQSNSRRMETRRKPIPHWKKQPRKEQSNCSC